MSEPTDSPLGFLASQTEYQDKLRKSREARDRAALKFALGRSRPADSSGRARVEDQLADARASKVLDTIDRGVQYGPDRVLSDINAYERTGDFQGEQKPGLTSNERSDYYDRLRANESILDFYERNPDAAMVAPKDMGTLEGLASIFKAFGSFVSGTVSAILRGDDRDELQEEADFAAGDVAFAKILGGLQGESMLVGPFEGTPEARRVELSPPLSVEEAVARYRGAQRALRDFNGGRQPEAFSAEQAFETTGQIINQYQGTILSGLKVGVAGGLLTGTPAAAAAAPTGVGVLPAFLGGAFPGFQTGFQVGAASRIFRREFGQFYGQFGLDTRDDSGELPDDASAIGASILYGGLSTGVELYAFNTGLDFYGSAAVKAAKSQLKARVFNLLKSKAARITLAQLGNKYVKTVAAETGEEVIQTMLQLFLEDAAKLSDGDFGDVQSIDDLLNGLTSPEGLSQIGQAAFGAGTGTALFALPGLGAGSIKTRSQILQSRAETEFFDGLEQGAQESELKQKAPGLFREFVRQMADGQKFENVYIAPDKLTAAFQQAGLDERAAEKIVPGVREKVRAAVETGRDVEIPLADFAEHFAGTELMPGVRSHIKLDETGLTNAEAVELAKRDPEAQLTETPESILAIEQSADRVAQMVHDQLLATGRVSEEQAREGAAIFRTRMRTLSVLLSSPAQTVTPEEAFNRFPLQITGQATSETALLQTAREDIQAVVDAAPVFKKMSDAVPARDGYVYRIITGPEFADFLQRGELRPGQAADTGGTVNFSKEPIPVYGGSAFKNAGLIVEVPESAIPNARIYTGSKDVYAASKDAVSKQAVTRAWGFQFGGGLRVAEVPTDVLFKQPARRPLQQPRTLSQRISDALTPPLLRTFGQPEPQTFEQPAYHGGVSSAHLEGGKLRVDFSGTGAGNAQGFGIYASELVDVARFYRDNLLGPIVKKIRFVSPISGNPVVVRDGVSLVAALGMQQNQFAPVARAVAYSAIQERSVEAALAQLEQRKSVAGNSFELFDEAASIVRAFNRLVGFDSEFFEEREREGSAAVHRIEIPENDELAQWDLPLSEQPEKVKDGLKRVVEILRERPEDFRPGNSDNEFFQSVIRDLDAVVNDGADDFGRSFEALYFALQAGDPGGSWVSRLFNEAGIPGHRYKSGSGDHYNYVIWDDTAIQMLEEFQQPDRGQIQFDDQGAIIRLLESQDASTFFHELGHYFVQQMVELQRTGQSTPEIDEQLQAIVEWAEVASVDELSLPYADGRTFEGRPDIPHERLARAFEVYLVEGTAPTKKLESVFAKLRGWIVAVYGGLKEVARNRGIALSPEVRDIFDRMLVVEREIDDVLGEDQGPTFGSAQEMGVSPDEYERYRALGDEAAESAKRKLSKRLIGEVRRNRREARRTLRDEVRAEVEQEVSNDPAWQALRWLKRGELPEGSVLVADTNIGLDRQAVHDLYGGDASRIIELLNAKPGAGQGRNVVAGESQNGLDPSDVAELFGFRSARALVDALLAARPLEERVSARVNEIMASRPDLSLDEAALEDAAMDAVADVPRETVLKAELAALRRLALGDVSGATSEAVRGEAQVPGAKETRAQVQAAQNALERAIREGAAPETLAELRSAVVEAERRQASAVEARREATAAVKRIREIEAGLDSLRLRRKALKLVGVVRVGDLRQQRRAWNATVQREGKKARKAIASRSYVEAAQALERQLLAHHAVDVASAAIEAVDKGQKYVAKFLKKGEQDKLRRGGFDGAAQIVRLLERWDFRAGAKRQQIEPGQFIPARETRALLREAKRAKVDETEQSLLDFTAKAEAAGYVMDIDEFFANPPEGRTSWRDLEVDHFSGLVSTIKNIEKVARGEVKSRNARARLTMEEAGLRIADQIRRLWPSRNAPKYLNPASVSSEKVKAAVRTGDALLLKREELFDFLGGDDITTNLLREFVWDPIQTAAEDELDLQVEFTAKLRGALARVDWKKFNRTLEFESLNGYRGKYHELIAMALNYGNESNWRKLVEGYKNEPDHRWTEAGILKAFEKIDDADWDFIQDVWDILNDLQPRIWQTHFEVTGTYPKKIEARPFVTPTGKTLKGGYYPVVYDPMKDKTEVTQRLLDKAQQLGMLGASWTKPDTDHGFVESRSESYARPIWLDLNVMANHVEKVIHDITHRQAIIQVYGVTRQAALRKAIEDTWGKEYVETIDAWVKAQANERFSYSHNGRFVEKFVRGLRSNITMMGLGYRLSTVVLQPLGLFNSVGEVGAGWMGRSLQRFSVHPIETVKFVLAHSREMQHRLGNNDRDIRRELRQLQGEIGPRAQVKRFAYHLIGYADMFVSTVTWQAQYAKSMELHGDDARAAKEADRAVRRSQGAGFAKDLVEFQEKGGAVQFAAMFYSYASALYAQQRRMALTAQENFVSNGLEVPVHKRRDFPRALARWFMSIVMPTIAAAWMRDSVPHDEGDGEEESWMAWLTKELIAAHMMPIPLFREWVEGALRGRLGTGTLNRPVEDAVALVFYDLPEAFIEDDPDWESTLRHALTTTGYAAGLPLGQIEVWVDNFWEESRDFSVRDLIYRTPRYRRNE